MGGENGSHSSGSGVGVGMFKMKLSSKNARFSYAGVLRQVIEKCVAGASVVDLCELGDQMILEETSKVYKKEKEMKKGRVCISCQAVPYRSSGIKLHNLFSLLQENTKLRCSLCHLSCIKDIKSCNYCSLRLLLRV